VCGRADPPPSAIGGVENSADLVSLEVLDDTLVGPLEGQGEESLTALQIFGAVGGGIASERVDGRQTHIPAGRAVAPLGLEVVEEGEHCSGARSSKSSLTTGRPRCAARKRSRSANASR